jgi:hypothetical protein
MAFASPESGLAEAHGGRHQVGELADAVDDALTPRRLIGTSH